MQSANPPQTNPSVRAAGAESTRRGLLGGTTSLLMGTAACLVGAPDLGIWLVLGGFMFVVLQLHRAGRAGPQFSLE